MAVQMYALLWISVCSVFKIQDTLPTCGLFRILVYAYRQTETINAKVEFCHGFIPNHSSFRFLQLLPSSFDYISFFLIRISFIAHLLFALYLVFFSILLLPGGLCQRFLLLNWLWNHPCGLRQFLFYWERKPLQTKDRVLSGIDQVTCWAFVLFELGPFGRMISFFICLGCSTE